MRYAFLFLVLAVLTTGCSRQYNEFIRFHDNGRAKPQLAFLPVVDHSQHDVPWNISEELTEGMRTKLMTRGVVYLSSHNSIQAILNRTDDSIMFEKDLSWAKRYAPHEFVAVVELIEHGSAAYERRAVRPIYPADGDAESVLMMKARLKVIDIRGEVPKVVLQQIVHSNHKIPKVREGLNYREMSWESEIYPGTPLGMAHARFERDIVAQLEHYIDTASQ